MTPLFDAIDEVAQRLVISELGRLYIEEKWKQHYEEQERNHKRTVPNMCQHCPNQKHEDVITLPR